MQLCMHAAEFEDFAGFVDYDNSFKNLRYMCNPSVRLLEFVCVTGTRSLIRFCTYVVSTSHTARSRYVHNSRYSCTVTWRGAWIERCAQNLRSHRREDAKKQG